MKKQEEEMQAKKVEFNKDDLIRYKMNQTVGWVFGRVIIIDENTITLRMINDEIVVLRKENLDRSIIRKRSQ